MKPAGLKLDFQLGMRMVDTESYGVQERELQRRLPHVPLEIIKHFLAQYQGNLDECYQRLRTHTPGATSPNMEPFFSEIGRTATISTSRPTDYHQRLSQYQTRPPQQDHRAIKRQFTWESGSSQTLPSRSELRHNSSQTQLRGLPPQPSSYTRDRHLQYNMGPGVWQGAESTYDGQETQRTWMTPTPQYSPVNNITISRVSLQRQQLEAIHKYQERLLQEVGALGDRIERKQQHLGRLRLEVSGLTTEEQISELREVIQTLEIDVNEAKRELQVVEMQSQMKEEQDMYTEEGSRWYCRECSFLNHPLMTICEKCDIPKLRAH